MCGAIGMSSKLTVCCEKGSVWNIADPARAKRTAALLLRPFNISSPTGPLFVSGKIYELREKQTQEKLNTLFSRDLYATVHYPSIIGYAVGMQRITST